MTCRACFTAWGELPDEACKNHTDATIELAIAMVRASLAERLDNAGALPSELLNQHSEIERAGWFMDDAESGIAAGVSPPYNVRFSHGRRWTNIYVNDHWFKFDHNAEGFVEMQFVRVVSAGKEES
jgi:hypothetical protein